MIAEVTLFAFLQPARVRGKAALLILAANVFSTAAGALLFWLLPDDFFEGWRYGFAGEEWQVGFSGRITSTATSQAALFALAHPWLVLVFAWSLAVLLELAVVLPASGRLKLRLPATCTALGNVASYGMLLGWALLGH